MSEDRYTRKGNAIFDRGKGIILLDREEEWKLLKSILAEANRAEKLEEALRELIEAQDDSEYERMEVTRYARVLLEPVERGDASCSRMSRTTKPVAPPPPPPTESVIGGKKSIYMQAESLKKLLNL